MKFLTLLITIFFILIPIGLFGWLLSNEFVVSGIFDISHEVSDVSPFIDSILPEFRVTPPQKNVSGDIVQTITDDPVYFFIHPHRSFETVDAKIWFRSKDTSIIEFGGLSAKNPDQYVLTPIKNTLIDESKWSRVTEGDLILLQRTNTYTSLSDFFSHPPSLNEIATYHTSVNTPYRISGYVPLFDFHTIDVSLRGRTKMKTYIKNESLDFLFQFMDMNRDEGSDPISISVFDEQGNAVGGSQSIDDGNISKNAFSSPMRSVHVLVPGLKEGVYKIVMDTGRDIFVRHITTPQQKLIFLNTIYFGDEVGYHETYSQTQFWTESKRLSFQTRQASGLQTIVVGSHNIDIFEPYRLVTQNITDQGLVNGLIKKGDVEVVSDSPVSLIKEQYFRPDPVRLLPHTDLDTLGVNYVLAKYVSPKQENGWSVATVTMNTNQLLSEQNSWKFSFSLPSIKEQGGSVEVKRIDLRLHRAPFSIQDLIKKISP